MWGGSRGGAGGYREGTRQPALFGSALWLLPLCSVFRSVPAKAELGRNKSPRLGLDFHATLAPPRRPAASGAGFGVRSRPLMAAVAVCSFSASLCASSFQRGGQVLASSPPQPQKKKSLFYSPHSPAAAMLVLGTAALASHARSWRGGDDRKSLAASVM